MKFIIGKKIEMTQVWEGEKVVAVTRIQAGPCVVSQIKTKKQDGYEAIQLGFGSRKEKNIKKPQLGHLAKITKAQPKVKINFSLLKEFKAPAEKLSVGDVIQVDSFAAGDVIQVTGISKGKGFQGVVKRHGFHGHPKTHGHKDQLRMPGSIGAGGVQHVFKGTRMAGRMGGEQVTTTNLKVVEVLAETNELLVKGAVPGARNSYVFISGPGELKIGQPQEEKQETPVFEPIAEEIKQESDKTEQK